jgi:hypothetical protein
MLSLTVPCSSSRRNSSNIMENSSNSSRMGSHSMVSCSLADRQYRSSSLSMDYPHFSNSPSMDNSNMEDINSSSNSLSLCWKQVQHDVLLHACYTSKNQFRKFETNMPFLGIARPQAQFPHHVSVSDLYNPTTNLLILLQEICGLIQGIYKSLTDI